jgi:hypothetical protein
MNKLAVYRKAVVAVVGAAVAIAVAFGVEVDSKVPEAIIAVATAALVYLVPNSQG